MNRQNHKDHSKIPYHAHHLSFQFWETHLLLLSIQSPLLYPFRRIRIEEKTAPHGSAFQRSMMQSHSTNLQIDSLVLRVKKKNRPLWKEPLWARRIVSESTKLGGLQRNTCEIHEPGSQTTTYHTCTSGCWMEYTSSGSSINHLTWVVLKQKHRSVTFRKDPWRTFRCL